MILSHTLKVSKLASNGKSVAQICQAFNGRYTEDQIEMFMPGADLEEVDDIKPTSECESLGVLNPNEPGIVPTEKGRRTKALNKARAEAEASNFE